MKNRHLHGIHVFRAVYAAVPFFRPCLRRGGGLVFPAPWQVPDGNHKLDVCSGCFALCGDGIPNIAEIYLPRRNRQSIQGKI